MKRQFVARRRALRCGGGRRMSTAGLGMTGTASRSFLESMSGRIMVVLLPQVGVQSTRLEGQNAQINVSRILFLFL